MFPKVADAIAELTQFEAEEPVVPEPDPLDELFAGLAGRAVPIGRLKRIWAYGGLQAQIFRAYLAYAVRSRFVDVDERDRRLAEAHLRAALKMLVSMSYLRGAVMKLGQAMASLPDILSDEIVSTLEHLHFDAPPMHFALLREHVRNELGRDPEQVFAEFNPSAIAAASIGQVHRARLSTGESLAVKIQYPGIGRAIRADFRSISALLLPLRLSKGWNRIKAQVEEPAATSSAGGPQAVPRFTRYPGCGTSGRVMASGAFLSSRLAEDLWRSQPRALCRRSNQVPNGPKMSLSDVMPKLKSTSVVPASVVAPPAM